MRGDLPEGVATKLKDCLFSAPSSFLRFAAAVLAAAALMWWRTSDIWLGSAAVAAAVLLIARFFVLSFYARRKAVGQFWDCAVHLALVNLIGSLFSLVVAALQIRAVYVGDIVSVQTATMITASYLVGLVSRVSAIPKLAVPHLFWLFFPLITVAVLAADLSYLMIAAFLLNTFFVFRALVWTSYQKIVAQLSAEHQLSIFARTDQLTGLANRTAFYEQGSAAAESARSRQSDCILALIDLDGFKSVNDTHGHGAGDELLKEVAARITVALRGKHLPVRLGGDEFAIIFECHASLDDAHELAGQIVTALQAPILDRGVKLQISASVGLACFENETDTLSSILERADKALYQAKNAGKNQVQLLRDAATACSLVPADGMADALAPASVAA